MSFFGKYYFASSQQHATAGEMQELLRMRGCGCGSGREPSNPPTDVFDSTRGYIVRMELAGVLPEDVEVHLSGTILTVQGCRRDPRISGRKAFLQLEIESGPFTRQITLPGPVDAEKAEARLDNGMLQVLIPHAAVAKTPTSDNMVRVRWCLLEHETSTEKTP